MPSFLQGPSSFPLEDDADGSPFADDSRPSGDGARPLSAEYKGFLQMTAAQAGDEAPSGSQGPALQPDDADGAAAVPAFEPEPAPSLTPKQRKARAGEVRDVDGTWTVGNVPITQLSVENVRAALGLDKPAAAQAHGAQEAAGEGEEEAPPPPVVSDIEPTEAEKQFLDQVNNMDDDAMMKMFGGL